MVSNENRIGHSAKGFTLDFPQRQSKILALEELRGSRIITLLTSVRPNWAAQLSDEQVRVIYDHLLRIRGDAHKIPKLDLFIMSNGGDSLVPWRLISVFRDFADKISVLVPYRAYSAATLLALGADEIVMGPFGQLGPIDPTVQNDFNPIDEQTKQRIGVSVEDVKSFIQFIKTTVGITHEDELIRAVEALLTKVHPLALGNVERFIQQSRMIAQKLLRTHMTADSDKHIIDELIENMASKLYFHGHPISRLEARQDLQLRTVIESSRTLDDALWALYEEYELLFNMRDPVLAPVELARQRIANIGKANQYSTAVETMVAQNVPLSQAIQLAIAHLNASGSPTSASFEVNSPAVAIESSSRSSLLMVHQRWELLPDPAPGQTMIRQDLLDQKWINTDYPVSGQTGVNLMANSTEPLSKTVPDKEDSAKT